ncbi:MAG: DUF4188 domain-containing protein [Thiothrix sp.]|nr:DUF4188 domain-containing protein [Thiothrix sp.]
MKKIYQQRMTAEMDGDFVLFLIGMRVNKPWKIHKWFPVFRAMPRMLKELDANPELGCLGHSSLGPVIVQYWKSFSALEDYARDPSHTHLPAWSDFNRRVGRSRGDVGIWHETYLVTNGDYEAVYSGMPAFGLGAAGKLCPAQGRRESARGRLELEPESQTSE